MRAVARFASFGCLDAFFLGLTPQALRCRPLRGLGPSNRALWASLKQLELDCQVLLRILAEVVEQLDAF